MHILINEYDLLLLVIQVFDLAINSMICFSIQVFDLAKKSIQVGYAFIPYLELHISFRIDIKAKIHGLGEDSNTIE
jgi:hypothetical protein